jgi:hypothetical protein
MSFDVRPFQLKIRVTKSWLLYDYPTGGDALVDRLHIGALNEVVKDYKYMKGRYGHGVKLNVDGYASNSAKDPRYDNKALAKRRATNVVAYLRKQGVAQEDISEAMSAVAGEAGKDEPKHRSVLVARGMCASDQFSVYWSLADDAASAVDIFADKLEIYDNQWKLKSTFQVVKHGTHPNPPLRPDDEPVNPLPKHASLQLLTSMGSASATTGNDANFVSLNAFHLTLANLMTTRALVTMGGVFTHQPVAFNGFGDNPLNPSGDWQGEDEETCTLHMMARGIEPFTQLPG